MTAIRLFAWFLVDDVSEKIILHHNEAFPGARNCMIWPKFGHKDPFNWATFPFVVLWASRLKNKSEEQNNKELYLSCPTIIYVETL